MTTDEIRKTFLDFFTSKGHRVVSSDSVVPKNDPTVLFTTAGMQQFKEQFLGHAIEYRRAATAQKCLRTDDLDKVGKTNFHHSFFEMLGNFSFGDYFKKEAIAWGWEFLTQVLNIPKEKLWVSVYREDKEAKEIWLKDIKIDPKKLVELGDKSNFWPSEAREKGPNGPCGPCSEIFFDYGFNKDCTSKVCDPDCSCGRFSEVWNLVFTQYNRKEGGVLEPLPSKNIDTGMGLERLVSVIQGKKSNFEIDVFAPIFADIKKFINADGKLSQEQERIIADHIRAITIGITDGVTPSNEGRGYIMKKLIIDITDIVLQAGKVEPVIYKLVPAVGEAFKTVYPEITHKSGMIQDVVRKIEESYIRVRKERIPELIDELNRIQPLLEGEKVKALGEIMFRYRDTFGLTIPTILSVIESSRIASHTLNSAQTVFQKLMEEQQNKSRQSSKMTGDVFASTQIHAGMPKTIFWGYEQIQNQANVLKIVVADKDVDEAHKGDEVKIILDETPFYAESGGQVGDTGYLTGTKGKVRVTDTQKMTDIYIHVGVVEEGMIKKSEHVEAKIDADRRAYIKANHTATHLLQAAMREVLGSHVQQQGSLVDKDRLRFDFTHHNAISEGEIQKIENKVNEYVRACVTVNKDIMSIDEAKKSGALAFFAEKYGDRVRVVSIDKISKEFCGGTHIDATGQIGLFKIVSESAIAQGIRRIEAKTGVGALEFVRQEEKLLSEAAKTLKSPVNELVNRINLQSKRLKELESENEEVRFERIKDSLDQIINDSAVVGTSRLISSTFINIEMGLLRKVADLVKQKAKSAVIILGSRTVESASIIIAVSDDLIERNIKANELITPVAAMINGNGGGRPQLAQAGSKEIAKVDLAVKEAERIAREKLSQ
jgi:alanyl-tRNA synthetase